MKKKLKLKEKRNKSQKKKHKGKKRKKMVQGRFYNRPITGGKNHNGPAHTKDMAPERVHTRSLCKYRRLFL